MDLLDDGNPCLVNIRNLLVFLAHLSAIIYQKKHFLALTKKSPGCLFQKKEHILSRGVTKMKNDFEKMTTEEKMAIYGWSRELVSA